MKMKKSNVVADSAYKKHDAFYEAASNRKVDFSQPRRPETGIKITVGGNETSEAGNTEATYTGIIEEEDDMIGVDFEPFF